MGKKHEIFNTNKLPVRKYLFGLYCFSKPYNKKYFHKCVTLTLADPRPFESFCAHRHLRTTVYIKQA